MIKHAMIKKAVVLSTALIVGSFAANAESSISTNGLKATESAVSIGTVTADKDGYVVVHSTDFTGTLPGAVIGHAAVKAGQNAEVSVPLDRKTKAGDKLIVMLHEEGDNNTAFDAADKPVKSGGGPVQQIVTVE